MVAEIQPAELAALLAEDASVRVVDIRSPAMFRQGHIPGSENVPFPVLAQGGADLAGADHVVTVCPHGHDSLKAARLVGAYEGIDDARVESLAGGLSAWEGDLVSSRSDDDAAGDGASTGPEPPF
jgi:rhodanese-related sulfurtransferase